MIDVDLAVPILLTRATLLALRASGEAMVVNLASGIALIGAPFYATKAVVHYLELLYDYWKQAPGIVAANHAI
ncbi:hypothetical protein [Paraburkholderia hospita]|uniref:hypothetical protein n=1 Tax=Paraburkholderia hospita TaxID=169430 RepID=UPI000B345F8E|nr:hypothetical protein [Paraburkholderia hospita]OUL79519.1 hypothetical protein CA601_34655 [Paraburkholderia hospita]